MNIFCDDVRRYADKDGGYEMYFDYDIVPANTTWVKAEYQNHWVRYCKYLNIPYVFVKTASLPTRNCEPYEKNGVLISAGDRKKLLKYIWQKGKRTPTILRHSDSYKNYCTRIKKEQNQMELQLKRFEQRRSFYKGRQERFMSMYHNLIDESIDVEIWNESIRINPFRSIGRKITKPTAMSEQESQLAQLYCTEYGQILPVSVEQFICGQIRNIHTGEIQPACYQQKRLVLYYYRKIIGVSKKHVTLRAIQEVGINAPENQIEQLSVIVNVPAPKYDSGDPWIFELEE